MHHFWWVIQAELALLDKHYKRIHELETAELVKRIEQLEKELSEKDNKKEAD